MPTRRVDSRSGSRNLPARESEEDRLLSRGRRAALIQLKFGRAAHLLSMITAVMLAIAAIIAFLISNWDVLPGSQPLLEAMVLFIPLFTAAAISIAIIYLKWDPFLTDKGSKHFITSFVAFAVPLIMIILIILKQMGYADVADDLWIYPASFIGISLSFISIAMIWEGMSRRKFIAIASALVPPVIMSTTFLTNQADIYGMLPLVYLGSAVCIQLSGSMMHVISTSTSIQEREMLKAGDAKIIQIRDDAQKIKDQLEYKERALMEREVAFESIDRALADLKLDLDQRKKQIEILEEDQAKREMQLREEREKTSAAVLGISHREEKLQQKELELNSKEKELETITLALQGKEEQLKEQADQLQIDQTNLRVSEKQLKERQELIHEELANLKSSREALLAEQKKHTEKARDLKLKESSLDMRLRSADSSKSHSGQDTGRLKQWEEKLLLKEEDLSKVESELKERMREPEQLMVQAELKMSSVEDRLKEIEAKERALLEREAAAERLEKEIISGREDIQQKMMEMDSLRSEAATKKMKYDAMIDGLAKRAAEIAKREEMIRAGSTTMETRERSMTSTLDRVQREKQEIEAQRRSLIELEKRLNARSSQLQMREVQMIEHRKEVEATLRSSAEPPGPPADMADDVKQRERALDLREKMLADRERDLRKRAYASSMADEGEAEEIAPAQVAAKIGTGTKRLDDLLMGGLTPGSSVLFVGPPYTGKEVGILAFLADGLKKGIPAIVITTSKTPNDLVKDFAPILPTLLEVEHLGLVRWIDATAGMAQNNTASDRMNYIKVEGPDDFPGIIEAVDKMTDDVRQGHYPCFKMGYLSLSTSISHTDEMEATKFVQAVTRNVRDLNSSAIFALERGMHSEQQIESIQHLVDGAIMIKLDKQKTYLSILGVGEVQSRDWIEFKHTSAGLVIGAFSLERIR
jgi:KaiC/GvpD/RAD55 family RecA-like ATPase